MVQVWLKPFFTTFNEIQDYKSAVKEYEYPFEYVMEAYQRRFGENGCPDIPIIKEMDVKEDTDQDGVHNILRRCR